MSKDAIVLRDHRRPGWFWAENEIIDNHLLSIGETAFTIYMVLARYVNNQTGDARISVNRIGEKIGKSRSTVMRNLSLLEKAGLIAKKRHGDREVNSYAICQANRDSLVSPMTPPGVTHDTPLVSPMTPDSRLSSQDSVFKKEDERNKVAPSVPKTDKNDLGDPPSNYIWITSSISTEKHIHLAGSEKGKILCGASLKHRTTDYQHVAATIPCPECLKAAQKPKLEQPPKEVKDRFAQICFGQSNDLTPASWTLIVKAWNQMGKPDLAELKALEDAWFQHDWRGKKGERPKPLQLAAERDSLKAKSVPPPKREHYGVQLTAAQQEMYAKYPILEQFPASQWAWRVREQNFK